MTAAIAAAASLAGLCLLKNGRLRYLQMTRLFMIAGTAIWMWHPDSQLWMSRLGVVNILAAAPVFLLFRWMRLPLFGSLALLSACIFAPALSGLSSYYWIYSVGNALILLLLSFFYLGNAVLIVAFSALFCVLAFTLQKYGVVYAAIVAWILWRRGLRRYLFAASAMLIVILPIGLSYSQYATFEEFVDRRITRESYDAARGQTLLGVSDGLRSDIWRVQYDQILERPLFGFGASWREYNGVPNHNFIVTTLLSLGAFGAVLFAWQLVADARAISDPFFTFPLVALLALSLVGEGYVLPLVAVSFFAQAGAFSGTILRRWEKLTFRHTASGHGLGRAV